jgi:hypothetical protein
MNGHLFGEMVRYFDPERGRQWPAIVTSEFENGRVDLTVFTTGNQLFPKVVEEGAEPGQWSPMDAEAPSDSNLQDVVALIRTLAPDERSRLNVTVPGFVDALEKVVGGRNSEQFEPVLQIRRAEAAIREGHYENAMLTLSSLAPELDSWAEAIMQRLEAAERAAR